MLSLMAYTVASKYDMVFNRWRATLRHAMGNGVKGWSLGLAASF
ncbi:MAG TPA: hypothetical protein VFZ28_11025 [Burkholderiaceae bacterium]|nr:hypothetical protein [Burkholderiaceae bacterium]